jgi:HEAT repeat protein
MANTNYQSRQWAVQMKLRDKYKKFNSDKLMSIVEKESTINKRAAAMEMQIRGGEDVITYAMGLCSNKSYKLREIGAFILGQVAVPKPHTLLKVVTLLVNLAKEEKSIRVRYTAIYSLGHRCSKGFTGYDIVIPALEKAANDPIASVRESVAFSLAYILSPDTVPILEKLLLDTDTDVRNWAGFAVNNSGSDSIGIREALVKLLDDPFDEVRLEAISALASWQDMRVISAMKYELEKELPAVTVVEATADFGDPQFIPILEKLLKRLDDSDWLIQNAINKLKKTSY